MPRYFFHLHYGPDKRAPDPEGEILPGPEAVRSHALAAARGLVAQTRSDAVRDWFVCAFEVVDEAGTPVLTVPFGDILPDERD